MDGGTGGYGIRPYGIPVYSNRGGAVFICHALLCSLKGGDFRKYFFIRVKDSICGISPSNITALKALDSYDETILAIPDSFNFAYSIEIVEEYYDKLPVADKFRSPEIELLPVAG